jgi:hypothetical protein
MTSGRRMVPIAAPLLALTFAVGATGVAPAQTLPWPGEAPKSQAPWPSNPPPAQPMMGTPAAAPVGPPMGGPPPEVQACLNQFNSRREEAEKRAMAAKAGSEKKVPREEMCKLVSAYSDAEARWIKFSKDNMTKCGIPREAVQQIEGVHGRTLKVRKQICSAGPAGGGAPATPSLSDALTTTRMPTAAAERPKATGTLNTLTGNPLTR